MCSVVAAAHVAVIVLAAEKGWKAVAVDWPVGMAFAERVAAGSAAVLLFG